MSRFAGFQSDQGVAVLDTVTGELTLHPFDGSEPRVLRPATYPEEAPATHLPAVVLPRAPSVTPIARPARRVEAPSADEVGASFRPARRLGQPRPMEIRPPTDAEVAAIKAARLARGERSGPGEEER
jgi:hypothetical protein